jgi:SAM-dependent methyltransferase
MPVSLPSASSSTLQRRIAKLAQVFQLDAISAQAMGPAQIAEHYENCFGAYRRRHSSEGSLHLALNDGRRFDEAGFSGQAARLQALWAGQRHAEVLELGFGQGYNLSVLAPALPATRFSGVDITPGHVAHVQALLKERALPMPTRDRATSMPCPGQTPASTRSTR